MEATTNPTDAVRDFAETRADNICADIARAETEVKCILDQKVYQNGVRGSAMVIRDKLEDIQALVTKLRKAIHDDFGPRPLLETKHTFSNTRDPEEVAAEGLDILSEMEEATDGPD